MDSNSQQTCTFIIKLWVEEFDEKNIAKWRGHITHALTGERKYFEDATTALNFSSSYLAAIGIDLENSTIQNTIQHMTVNCG